MFGDLSVLEACSVSSRKNYAHVVRYEDGTVGSLPLEPSVGLSHFLLSYPCFYTYLFLSLFILSTRVRRSRAASLDSPSAGRGYSGKDCSITAQNIRRAALRQNHPQPAPRVIQTPATSVISLTELRPATPDTQQTIARPSRSSHRLQLLHPPPVS